MESPNELAVHTPLPFPQVIAATNRVDILDPALLRSGRLDRKIEFPLPNKKQKRLIFNAITSKMNLSNVDLESFVEKNDKMSAADIHSVCQEAGMLAIRNSRYSVLMEDFEAAYGKVLGLRQSGLLFYKWSYIYIHINYNYK